MKTALTLSALAFIIWIHRRHTRALRTELDDAHAAIRSEYGEALLA